MLNRTKKYKLIFVRPKANKVFGLHTKNRGVPRIIRLDQANFFVRYQVKNICNMRLNKIDIIEAPVIDHRTIELIKRLIQTINNLLACNKEEKLAANLST